MLTALLELLKKIDGSYEWFKHKIRYGDGFECWTYDGSCLYDIIKNNRYNQNTKIYSNVKHKTVDCLTGSYISFVEEEAFLKDPSYYINNAFDKSENDGEGYDIHPTN